MSEDEKDVHTEHCCSVHGCKYGDAACTVASGEKPQSFPCEFCEELMSWTMTRETANVLMAALAEAGAWSGMRALILTFQGADPEKIAKAHEQEAGYEHVRGILAEVLEKHGLRVCPFRADPHTLAECLAAEHERSEGR